MSKQVPWNKIILETFISEGCLTKDEEIIIRTRVAGWSRTIGMTDGRTNTIYMYKGLRGKLLDKVLAHELVHAFMFSYDIRIDMDQEEFMANWVSVYGRELIYLLDDIIEKAKAGSQG